MKSILRFVAAIIVVVGAWPAYAAVVIRGPYLQTPTPATMTLRWRTDTPTTSRVSYGAAPASLTLMTDDLTVTTEHVVTVTGLSADTQYFYAIGSTGGVLVGDDADHWFRTAPTTGTVKPLRLWTIGDAGFTGPDLDAVRDAYAAFNGSNPTDLFLLLGDNAYVQGTDAQYQAAVFGEHAALLRTTPVYSVVGNHEVLSSNSITQVGPYFAMFSFPTAGEAGGVASGTESYFSFDYANVHFIVLDSEQAPGSSSTPMLTWLEADLQATTADWMIALWHRPPYSRGLLHNSDFELQEGNMRAYALPILDAYGVDVVLSGHSHSYERSYLLDGHYGPSSTFSASHQMDAGDGDPNGDGAYQKDLGQVAHSGAVYVVNGSGSEVRPATLDHPAMVVGLLELGSVVVDIDGNTLTASMLDDAAQVRDTFRVVKAEFCAPAPRSGCGTAGRGALRLNTNADPAKNKWSWQWSRGAVSGVDVGDPTAQTDFGLCVYDGGGLLVGGFVPHGAAWSATRFGFRYVDALAHRSGLRKLEIRPDAGTKGRLRAVAKGSRIGAPATPVTLPVTAQLVNPATGACWESTFTTAKKNEAGKLSTSLP
jgi:hypothetical protein